MIEPGSVVGPALPDMSVVLDMTSVVDTEELSEVTLVDWPDTDNESNRMPKRKCSGTVKPVWWKREKTFYTIISTYYNNNTMIK